MKIHHEELKTRLMISIPRSKRIRVIVFGQFCTHMAIFLNRDVCSLEKYPEIFLRTNIIFPGNKVSNQPIFKIFQKCHFISELFKNFLHSIRIKMRLDINFLKLISDLRKYDNLKKSYQ